LNKITKSRERIEKLKSEKDNEFKSEDLNRIIKDLTENLVSSDLPSLLGEKSDISILMESPEQFKVTEPIDPLTDMNFRADLETLIPGLADKIMKGDARLQKQQLDIVRNSISHSESNKPLNLIMLHVLNSVRIVKGHDSETSELFTNLMQLYTPKTQKDIGKFPYPKYNPNVSVEYDVEGFFKEG
jgi:hypothetical protein